MFSTPIFGFLAVVASVSALILPRQDVELPIRLVFPYSRGTSVATAANGPCQGYPAQVSNRTVFPLSGGKFAFADSKGVNNLTISYASNYTNPTFRRFLPAVASVPTGSVCFDEPLDFNQYGSGPGRNLTFGFSWTTTAGVQQYECADILFVDSFDFTTVLTDVCINNTALTSTPSTSAGASAVVSASAAASASSSAAGTTSGAMGRFEVAMGAAIVFGAVSVVAALL